MEVFWALSLSHVEQCAKHLFCTHLALSKYTALTPWLALAVFPLFLSPVLCECMWEIERYGEWVDVKTREREIKASHSAKVFGFVCWLYLTAFRRSLSVRTWKAWRQNPRGRPNTCRSISKGEKYMARYRKINITQNQGDVVEITRHWTVWHFWMSFCLNCARETFGFRNQMFELNHCFSSESIHFLRNSWE